MLLWCLYCCGVIVVWLQCFCRCGDVVVCSTSMISCYVVISLSSAPHIPPYVVYQSSAYNIKEVAPMFRVCHAAFAFSDSVFMVSSHVVLPSASSLLHAL